MAHDSYTAKASAGKILLRICQRLKHQSRRNVEGVIYSPQLGYFHILNLVAQISGLHLLEQCHYSIFESRAVVESEIDSQI